MENILSDQDIVTLRDSLAGTVILPTDAEYNLARKASGGRAMAIITVDSPLDAGTLSFLKSFKEMEEVRQVRL